jgi:hypothetical protein
MIPEFEAGQAIIERWLWLLGIKATCSERLSEDGVQIQEPSKEVFDRDDAGYDNPVHEPWSQLGLIICFECFVTSKDGEEECGDGTTRISKDLLDPRLQDSRRRSDRMGEIRDDSADDSKHEDRGQYRNSL